MEGNGKHDDYGMCPLTFNVCPGPNRCAPARFMAQKRFDDLEKERGVDVEEPPLCPIAVMCDATAHAAAGLAYIAMTPNDDEDEETPEHADEDARKRALLKRDYGLDLDAEHDDARRPPTDA